jgi:hypothetical protein
MGIVVLASVSVAYFSCLLDPKTRSNYLTSANECYRITSKLVILSAAIIVSNHLFPWAENLYSATKVQNDALSIQLWVLAGFAGILSFGVALLLSCWQPSFWAALPSGTSEIVRLIIWLVFFLLSSSLLTRAMFLMPN